MSPVRLQGEKKRDQKSGEKLWKGEDPFDLCKKTAFRDKTFVFRKAGKGPRKQRRSEWFEGVTETALFLQREGSCCRKRGTENRWKMSSFINQACRRYRRKARRIRSVFRRISTGNAHCLGLKRKKGGRGTESFMKGKKKSRCRLKKGESRKGLRVRVLGIGGNIQNVGEG